MNTAARGTVYVVLWVAVGAAIFGGWRMTLGAKERAARATLAGEVAGLEQRVSALAAAATRESELRSELRVLETEKAALDRSVPRATDEQAFVLAFDARARNLDLMVSGLRWEARRPRDLATAAPLTLEVRGGFERALQFAAGVATGEPLVAVQSVSLQRGPLSTLTVKGEALAVPEG